jgi:hypothetical protein
MFSTAQIIAMCLGWLAFLSPFYSNVFSSVSPFSSTCNSISMAKLELNKDGKLNPSILSIFEWFESACSRQFSLFSYFGHTATDVLSYLKETTTFKDEQEVAILQMVQMLSNISYFHIICSLLLSPFFSLTNLFYSLPTFYFCCWFKQIPVKATFIKEGFWIALFSAIIEYLEFKRKQRQMEQQNNRQIIY